MAKSCANCAFCHTAPDSLYCRRNPPTAAFVYVPGPGNQPELVIRSTFPPVPAGMWCGEHRVGVMLPTAADERLLGTVVEGRA